MEATLCQIAGNSNRRRRRRGSAPRPDQRADAIKAASPEHDEISLIRKGNGSTLPLPLRERVGVRGYGLTIDRNPSPGSHPAMRSDLSTRGEVKRATRGTDSIKRHHVLAMAGD